VGQILNRYDATGSQYKYIHCDLTDGKGLHTITLITTEGFAFAFSSKLHVEAFVKVINFNVYNKSIHQHGNSLYI
jgi:hypothetical protein